MFQGIFKEVKTKDKIFRQTWIKYLETSSILVQLFFTTSSTELDHYNQKVSVEVVERLNTYILKKLRNFQKICEMLGFDGEYSVVQPNAKFWLFLVKNGKKISSNTFHRKIYFACFRQFVSKLLSKIVWEKKIHS